ncbi:MAG: cation-transporting P-type ATPase, partial [Actinomycetota bacterium]
MTDTATLVARGLSSVEAERLLVERGPNQLPSAKPRNLLQQAAGVLREPMLLFLVAAGVINFAIAEPLDGVILMCTVVIVIGISIAQEHRTENALVALRDLSSPRALVVRDGVRVRIPGAEVVPGDVVVLAEGDRVPADALVLDAVGLSVDESALTGESVPVRKVAAAPGGAGGARGAPRGGAAPGAPPPGARRRPGGRGDLSHRDGLVGECRLVDGEPDGVEDER